MKTPQILQEWRRIVRTEYNSDGLAGVSRLPEFDGIWNDLIGGDVPPEAGAMEWREILRRKLTERIGNRFGLSAKAVKALLRPYTHLLNL